MLRKLNDSITSQVDFWEVAPENWIGLGGAKGKRFRAMTERFKFVTHGLSLSIGGPTPLDVEFLQSLKKFLDIHGIDTYTEHLSYCSDHGHLYDLMPIPFTSEAATYVSDRVKQVQDTLGRKIALENVSYYAAPNQEMSELDFLTAVIEQSDCDLLLDVNNVYVNSINHGYNPQEFIAALPSSKLSYIHIAGHYDEAEDLKVDTHGADVIEPVWGLLDYAYQQHGYHPTLLERDFNLPEMPVLVQEVDKIRTIQSPYIHETTNRTPSLEASERKVS